MPSPRTGRARAVATVTAPLRCAIYTRKSTDEGLDRDFSSLDNQREAAENYIASQRHEGWTALPDRYDDAGVSGATLQRSALKRLLADIEARKIDCVVVYKLDRLSRSVRDYLNLLAFLDEHGVDFVSVTQQFNTATVLGRMTLKQLLLFAEFERDMIAERTRDKVHAARRRGKWTGGHPPLGYDTAPEGGRLVVNKDEAAVVSEIFRLYCEQPSLVKLATELNRRGWRRKSWTTRDGKRRQGGQWDRVSLRRLLTDPIYIGMQKLGDEVFPGEHRAIVPKDLFNEVQARMFENRENGGARGRNRYGALLRGLIRCAACDRAMTYITAKKGTKAYRYYKCQRRQKEGAAACPTKSIPADKVEAFVVDQIRRIGADPELQRETFRQAQAQVKADRRGLKAEARRLERDLANARKQTEKLVATLTDSTGAARHAVNAELEKAQEHVQTLEGRLAEIRIRQADLDAQHIDQADLARALGAFDPIWEVLLVPEREKVLRLLINCIQYHGETQQMTISWKLAGFAEFADEVGDE